MKKILATLAVSATLAIGAVASPTTAEARWHHGFPVAPVIGGLAAGALIGAAPAPRPYYAYDYEPVYFGPRCYIWRERFWDGWLGTFVASRIATERARVQHSGAQRCQTSDASGDMRTVSPHHFRGCADAYRHPS